MEQGGGKTRSLRRAESYLLAPSATAVQQITAREPALRMEKKEEEEDDEEEKVYMRGMSHVGLAGGGDCNMLGNRLWKKCKRTKHPNQNALQRKDLTSITGGVGRGGWRGKPRLRCRNTSCSLQKHRLACCPRSWRCSSPWVSCGPRALRSF
ncbi:unnamed protein product [Prorocentrum cordatum]|uniref:Uncharacterized protein n=1 Tax=Prorocentrum cordatum TaxID=2364126 RepID=A0ABN9QQC3_9DINO|nr:unnamed protein product [Polarella glacialis]